MNRFNTCVRIVFMAIAVAGVIFLAEYILPMGGLLLFLLLVSIGVTWTIISLLRDDTVISDLFD